jgi:hypothetical protein
MKGIILAILIAAGLILLFGCTGGQTPAAQPPEAPAAAPAPPSSTSSTTANPERQAPEKNVTQPAPPSPPPFKPIHLSYLLAINEQNGQEQKVNFDYYLQEKATCNGRSALNGFVKVAPEGQPGAMYQKLTVYLDSGEAVYSDAISEPDLAFDTAKPKLPDFDSAFYLQTIAARGGKNLLSDEVWNATSPILLKNIQAFGAVSDYSITSSSTGTVASLPCKKFIAAVKGSSMQGQLAFCVHHLSDLPLSILANVQILGEQNAPTWQLAAKTYEKSAMAYYPQCLSPISCPSVALPAQKDYDACTAQGNGYVLEPQRDVNNCITAFKCMGLAERARASVSQSQRPGCAIDEGFIQQVSDCWSKEGNINYQYGDDGCISKVECQPGQARPPQGNRPPKQ